MWQLSAHVTLYSWCCFYLRCTSLQGVMFKIPNNLSDTSIPIRAWARLWNTRDVPGINPIGFGSWGCPGANNEWQGREKLMGLQTLCQLVIKYFNILKSKLAAWVARQLNNSLSLPCPSLCSISLTLIFTVRNHFLWEPFSDLPGASLFPFSSNSLYPICGFIVIPVFPFCTSCSQLCLYPLDCKPRGARGHV